MVSSGLGVTIRTPPKAKEFDGRGIVVRRFMPRIDFEFAALFPPQRSPSPVALDLVESVRKELEQMNLMASVGIDSRLNVGNARSGRD
jgi:hypothetical protein